MSSSTHVRAKSDLHLRVGWWALFGFVVLGLVLEGLHGLKVDWYLSLANSTRRLMWTLAHAHGTLLALINLVLAVTIDRLPSLSASRLRLASNSLLLATATLPLGFLLGGLFVRSGDPGFGVVLVPFGGGFLAVSILVIARSTSRKD